MNEDDKKEFEPFTPEAGAQEDSPSKSGHDTSNPLEEGEALEEEGVARDDDEQEEGEELSPVRYAGLNRRMLSATIDLMVMILILMPAAGWLEGGGPIAPVYPEFWQKFVVSHLNYISFFAVYSLVFWLLYATSPGKWMTGLRIVDIKTLEKPSTKVWFKRSFGYVVPGFITVFLFSLLQMPAVMAEAFREDVAVKVLVIMAFSAVMGSIGFLMIVGNRRKRGLHDIIAGTAVIIDYSHFRRFWRSSVQLYQRLRESQKK